MSDTIEEAVVKALDSKNIPAGKVRPVDKNILRMHMMGASQKEIAKELGIHLMTVSNRLNNPAVVQEIERLDVLTDKELIKLTVVSKRRMLEASLKAADKLVTLMDEAKHPGLQLKAIIKVLEYTHGKPHQSIAISPGIEKPLSDVDEKMLDEMIEGKENGDEDTGDPLPAPDNVSVDYDVKSEADGN